MGTVADLLARLSIRRVYWVDDENAALAEYDVDKLASEFSEQLLDADEAARPKAIGVFKSDERTRKIGQKLEEVLKTDNVDADLLESALRTGLDRAGIDPKALLVRALDALPQPLSDDQKAALKRVFEGSHSSKFEAISFATWSKKAGEILAPGARKDACLLVVDLQNNRETSPLSGTNVLVQWSVAISTRPRSAVYAIALTSSARKKDELVKGRQLANELFSSGVPTLPVIVVSKDRLADDQVADPVEASFVDSLGRLRAFTLHQQLSKSLSNTFEQATSEAFNSLQQLSIEELIYAVSTSSFYEGASEIETLTRMVTIAQRRALLKRLKSDGSIRKVLVEMRGLQLDGSHALKLEDLGSRDGLLALRRGEQFESADIVNGMFAPVSCGDVFEIQLADMRRGVFAVISNACDLMLRANGRRKLDHALLVRLPSKEFPNSGISIDALGTSCSISTSNEPLVIPLLALDLCWSNREGICTWERTPPKDWQKYRDLLPAQEARYQMVDKEFKRSGSGWVWRVAPNVKLRARLSVGGDVERVAFRMRRLGRLSLERSAQIVQEFVTTTARPSALHDFSA